MPARSWIRLRGPWRALVGLCAWACTEGRPAPPPAAAPRPVPAPEWTDPVSLSRGPDMLFRVPVLAVSESAAFVVSGPPGERTPGTARGAAFVGLRIGDRTAIPPPPGAHAFVFPRAETGQGDALHVVWAEPSTPGGIDTTPDLRSVRLASVWHATYHDGAWTPPRRIWQGGRVEWAPERGSTLVADDSGALHLAVSGEDAGGRWTLSHLRFHQGTWTRTEVGSAGPAAYADCAPGGNGGVAIVYSAARQDAAGSHVNALHLVRSSDGGASWGEPAVVGDGRHWPAFEPRVAMARGGAVHVVWARHAPGSSNAEALWHATSDGDGWRYSSLPAAGVFSGMQAVADRQGRMHVVLTAFRDRRAEVLYAASDSTGWTTLSPVDAGRMGAQPSIRIDRGGGLHLAWTAQPDGVTLPPRPAPGDTIPWFDLAYSTAAVR